MRSLSLSDIFLLWGVADYIWPLPFFALIFMNLKQIEQEIAKIENKLNDPDLCRGTASTYTRITGYFRSIENFNLGKKQEYIERLEYRPK